MRTSTYLLFDGNCREAFDFYRSVFGGEFEVMETFRSGPEGMDIPPEDLDKIMHMALPIGDGRIMGADIPAAFGDPKPAGGNFAVSVNPDSRSETDRIFHALAKGGSVLMPIEDMFWGGYFGHLKDRFGIQWMLHFEESQG